MTKQSEIEPADNDIDVSRTTYGNDIESCQDFRWLFAVVWLMNLFDEALERGRSLQAS